LGDTLMKLPKVSLLEGELKKRKKTIIVLSSSRAEKHLLAPVVDELRKYKRFNVIFWHMELDEYKNVADKIEQIKPHLVIVPCDRQEILRTAIELFYKRIPMAHFHAGDISKEGSHDDVARHMITLMCDIHFCNGEKAKQRVKTLLKTIGKDYSHVYNVGTTFLDNINIDYSQVPNEPFDLVLYNVPTKKPEEMDRDLRKIKRLLNKKTIWIYPCVDEGYKKIIEAIEEFKKEKDIISFTFLPHEQFLGLVEKCDRFIGNSSSMFLEAPYFKPKEKIIHIGSRNLERETPKLRKGASKRIAKILERIL